MRKVKRGEEQRAAETIWRPAPRTPATQGGKGDMEGKTETMEGRTSGGKSEVLIPPEWMREKGSTKLLDQRKTWGETMVRE